MQEPPLSCSVILVGIAILIGLFFFGFASAIEAMQTQTTDQQRMEQTVNAIRATNAQVETFIAQTEQARVATPTPAN
jgi:hypothetical protein